MSCSQALSLPTEMRHFDPEHGITSVGAWNKKHLGKLGSHQWMLLPDDAIEAKARCALVMTGAKNCSFCIMMRY